MATRSSWQKQWAIRWRLEQLYKTQSFRRIRLVEGISVGWGRRSEAGERLETWKACAEIRGQVELQSTHQKLTETEGALAQTADSLGNVREDTVRGHLVSPRRHSQCPSGIKWPHCGETLPGGRRRLLARFWRPRVEELCSGRSHGPHPQGPSLELV